MELSVPRKESLLAKYQQAQRVGKFLVLIETVLVIYLLLQIRLIEILDYYQESLVVVGVSVLPTFLSLGYLFAKKKKLVEDLKPSVKYGHLGKADILDVCETTCNRMGIKRNDISFFVTSDKQLNASALTLGLGYFFKSLRVVMFNRSTLHALKKEELMSIVAHELAHIYRYPLFYQEALLLRLFNSSVIGLSLFLTFQNVFIALIVVGLYQGLLAGWFSRYSITIEYLCDHCGAEVAGVLPALRAEFLISKHAETISEAYYHLLKARREGQSLGAKDLANLLEESLSYDCVSSDELNSAIEKNLKAHKEKSESSFFQYFKSQVFSDSLDAEFELENEFIRLKKIREIVVLPLPEKREELDLHWFKELVLRIRQSPNIPAFRTPNDLSDDGSTHPGPRKRMLYLWKEFVEM